MQPFVKWAGGKRQLLPAIEDRLPKKYGAYYEPFVGGGALLFSIHPPKAIIGDINEVLINTYIQIREDVESLAIKLDVLAHEYNYSTDKKKLYYQMRDLYNARIVDEDYGLMTVALFMYLNKTCFNGLYRVNSQGLFNVPFNNKETLNVYDKDNLNEISSYLSSVKILNCDFEETCKNVEKGDFVFFDSPYAPLKPESFETYTKEGFALEQHQRLARLYKELNDKGVYCMLTNHNTELINELYKDYKIEVVSVKRMINSDARNRVGEEVIITNY